MSLVSVACLGVLTLSKILVRDQGLILDQTLSRLERKRLNQLNEKSV